MPSRGGVSWESTATGKLDESEIPNDDYESHYIEDADTKSDSSFPVVDADNQLRRGNVESAWNQRGHAERDDFESIVKDLAEEFDNNPLPEDVYNGEHMELNLESDLEFSAYAPDELDFSSEEFTERVGEGFNEYGVRTNYSDDGDDLHSVDVIFTAMEPGPPDRRNGIRITEEFLRKVGSKDYSEEPPHLLDHRDKETFAKIGNVKQVWFSEQHEKLMLMARVPNTGAPTHTEAVSRYTFDPPSIRDGSLGFGNQYTAIRNENGEPELKDGKPREFSAVNFPGGYDEGGVAAAFAEEAVEAADAIEFDDPADDDDKSGENSAADSFSVTTETITF